MTADLKYSAFTDGKKREKFDKKPASRHVRVITMHDHFYSLIT